MFIAKNLKGDSKKYYSEEEYNELKNKLEKIKEIIKPRKLQYEIYQWYSDILQIIEGE